MREFRPVEGSLSTKLSSTHYIALAALDSAMNNNNNNTRDRCFPFDHCGSINGKTFNLFSYVLLKSLDLKSLAVLEIARMATLMLGQKYFI